MSMFLNEGCMCSAKFQFIINDKSIGKGAAVCRLTAHFCIVLNRNLIV